jgi:hypothetical protein
MAQAEMHSRNHSTILSPIPNQLPWDVSSEIATSKCPVEIIFEEVFLEGTKPRLSCHVHPVIGEKKPGFFQNLKQMFGGAPQEH